MTATTVQPTTLPTTATARERKVVPPIGMGRIVGVELRKMFDTRAGFWMLMSIAILSVLATGAAILFAPDADIDFQLFASAIGIPMSIILPMIAILSVTGEYTQRTGLTTYTMIPRRGRTIAAKAIAAVLVGVASMFVALVVGALGNVVGSAIAGVDTTWNVSVSEFAGIVLAQVLGMTIGFMLGVLLRSSAAAIVAYFVYSLVLPSLLDAPREPPVVVRRPPAVGRLQLRQQPSLRRDHDERVLGTARHQRPHLARRSARRGPGPGDAVRGEVTRVVRRAAGPRSGSGRRGAVRPQARVPDSTTSLIAV